MKASRTITYLIIKNIGEIFLVLSFCILSVFFIKKNDLKNRFLTNPIYTQVYVGKEMIFPNKFHTYNVFVTNETYTKEKYRLAFKLQDSFASKDSIYIRINEKVYPLNSFKEQDSAFILLEDEIVANNRNYEITVWQSDLEKEIQGNFLLQNVRRV